MTTVAVAIVCKIPTPGQSKTRLSPPLLPDECAAISACFIQDLARTIDLLARDGGIAPYAVYTPRGSEAALRALLPDSFELMPQGDGNLGARLIRATTDLLDAGHRGVILVNSDSPTLPLSILRAAVDALRERDQLVLGPSLDGGYTLIGLLKPHREVFEDIPWSTSAVYCRTLDRARNIDLPVVNVPSWYDVDDQASLQMLENEMSGQTPPFSTIVGAEAPATRRFLEQRQVVLAAPDPGHCMEA